MNALNSQFVQVALPIIITLAIAAWANKSGFDGMKSSIDGVNKRIDDVIQRLGLIEQRLARIETGLADHGERIGRLEERTSPLTRSK